ncbi:hypothetical protein NKR19_g940 [Coniochaeta hoffmannii]|uniref:Uncharacterized protein n=1 Tax=Coniochaeta hoffmannii TaxID=91930 RepID=A0AA38VTG5_9PEZI|nr:hypothetical protein NKR19_g940 [Coniochaeta hoffmannii]
MVNKTKQKKQKRKEKKEKKGAEAVAHQAADQPTTPTSTQASKSPCVVSSQAAHTSAPTQAANAPTPDDPIPPFSGLLISKPNSANFNVVDAWDDYFGEGTLDDWARLCRDLGLEGDFSSKNKCKKAMKGVWINIWDFLRTPNKENVRRFESEAALSSYTMKKSSRKYPRHMIDKDRVRREGKEKGKA